jgi:flagellar biogenesis protein FliO
MEQIFFKMFFSLAGVLLLMVFILFVMKRYLAGGTIQRPSSVNVEVLGMRTLHQKRCVYVLRVIDRVIVVGATDSTMQMLTEIDDEKSIKKIKTLVDTETVQNPGRSWIRWKKSNEETIKMPFAGLLSKAMKQANKTA